MIVHKPLCDRLHSIPGGGGVGGAGALLPNRACAGDGSNTAAATAAAAAPCLHSTHVCTLLSMNSGRDN
jgi:hypothetical protein